MLLQCYSRLLNVEAYRVEKTLFFLIFRIYIEYAVRISTNDRGEHYHRYLNRFTLLRRSISPTFVHQAKIRIWQHCIWQQETQFRQHLVTQSQP